MYKPKKNLLGSSIIGVLIITSIIACGGTSVIITENKGILTQPPKEVTVNPPIAKKITFSEKINGVVLTDNYHWLKDKTRKNPDVLAYLKAENAYTDKVVAHTKTFQEALYKEMVSRIKQTDLDVPIKKGENYYYSKTEKGKQYYVLCRKKGSLKAPEEVILDINELAKGHKFYDVSRTMLSDNQRYIAFGVDTNGSEMERLFIKDLQTGKMLKDTAYPIGSIAWANDNKTLFYSTINSAKRSEKIFRHILGTDQSEDKLIYHEKDDAYFAWIAKTRSKKFLILGSDSNTTSEVSYLKADDPQGNFKLMIARNQGVEYSVSNANDKFFILTNQDKAENYKLMVTSVEHPNKENWKEYIGTREDVLIENFDVFKNYMVIQEREKGLQRLRIINFNTNKEHYVSFPETVYSFQSHRNSEFDTDLFRLTYSSFITPSTVYDYNMKTKKLELRKKKEVLGGYNPENYNSLRLFATASDGTKVPISLVYRKDKFTQNGKNPLELEAYGSYGINSDPYFSSYRLSLLDRGFVYAIAHIRGGKELGEKWYNDGKMLHKKNTFTDFISCAEFLIEQHYTSANKLVIIGGSAGGMLMGAVTNMRPELFKVVIAEVPFVDVLNTMLDPTLSATVPEYEEWGNPHKKKYFDYIRSYCPYQNVHVQAYPNMIILGGFYDPRVNYWEPAKWTAKLRAMNQSNNQIILKINMAGHGGASGRYDYIKEIAFIDAVTFDLLGIKK